MAILNTLDIQSALKNGWTASDVLNQMAQEDAYISEWVDKRRKKRIEKCSPNKY